MTMTISLCPNCQTPDAWLKPGHDCTLELLKQLNSVRVQSHETRIREIYATRNETLETAAKCVEGEACHDLHDEFCGLYYHATPKCDCELSIIAEKIRELKVV